jgi:hypothetical protein
VHGGAPRARVALLKERLTIMSGTCRDVHRCLLQVSATSAVMRLVGAIRLDGFQLGDVGQPDGAAAAHPSADVRSKGEAGDRCWPANSRRCHLSLAPVSGPDS